LRPAVVVVESVRAEDRAELMRSSRVSARKAEARIVRKAIYTRNPTAKDRLEAEGWFARRFVSTNSSGLPRGMKKKNRRRKIGRQDVRFKEIRKMRCGRLFLEFQTKRAGGVKILWGWMSEWMKKKNSNEKISWLMNGSKRASKRKSEDEVTDGTRGRNFLFSLKVFKISFRLNRDDQLCQRIRT